MSHAAEPFNAGYLIAVANIVHLHLEDTIALDVLRELGCTRAEMQSLELSPYDRKVLHRLFNDLKRREAA